MLDQLLSSPPDALDVTQHDGRVLVSRILRGSVEISSESLRIHYEGRTVELPWGDIRAIRVGRRKRPGPARRLWRWFIGHDNGIVIDTPHGTFKTLDSWQPAISEWLARLLSEFAGVTFIEDEALDHAAIRRAPAKIARKGLLKLGVLGLLASAFFGYTGWPEFRDSLSIGTWNSADGVIDAIESVKLRRRSGSRLRITYHYDVQGVAYTNNRFRIDRSIAGEVERRKAKLAVGDAVEVWYDPDDPRRSTIERDTPLFTFATFLISTGTACACFTALIYAALGKNAVMAEHYARPKAHQT